MSDQADSERRTKLPSTCMSCTILNWFTICFQAQPSNKYITNPSIIYSEPQLSCPGSFTNPNAAYTNLVDANTIDALSESAINQVNFYFMFI